MRYTVINRVGNRCPGSALQIRDFFKKEKSVKCIAAAACAAVFLCLPPAGFSAGKVPPPAGHSAVGDLFGAVSVQKEHPRLILSRADLQRIRAEVESGARAERWQALKQRADNLCAGKWKPAVYTGDDSKKFYLSAMRDGCAARDLALAYHLSGEEKYAEQAVAVLSAWLNAEPLSASEFDPEIEYPNLGMLVARGSFPLLYAWDLLAGDGKIPPELTVRFRAWLRILEAQIREGEHRWVLNDYFDRQYYNNHLIAGAAGLMAIGIMLGDEAVVQYSVDSPENPRDIKDLIAGLILMEGDAPYYREPPATAPQTGEIMDRYRHFEIGGHWKDYVTKPNRGLQYAGLSSSLLVIAAEMGRLNGIDLYRWVAPTGETLRQPLDFYADFYIQKDASIKGGFYTGEDSWIGVNETTTHAIWEVAAARFPNEPKFKEVLRNYNRGSMDLHLLGPVSLTHGPVFSAVVPANSPCFKAAVSPQQPRLMFRAGQLAALASAVQKQEEPFFSAAQLVQVRCEGGMSYTADPYTGDDSALFYKHCLGPAGLARNLAMGGHLFSKKEYLQKSAQILSDWAAVRLGKELDHSSSAPDYPNASMKIARAVFPFICAYDLIKGDGVLSAQQDETIRVWFRQLADEIKEGVDEWHKNDYFNRQDYQNHVVAQTMGLLAVGYALGDQDLVQFALDSEAYERDLRDLIAGSILMKGDAVHHREPGGWELEDGEIYDRYRRRTGKGRRGLQYTHLTMTLLSASVRMAQNNGTDLVSYTAPGGENMRLPFEFYADFYRLKDSTLRHGAYSGECERIGKAGDDPGMYELGLAFYPDSVPVRQLLDSIDRGSAYMDLLGYTAFFARPSQN